MAAHGLVAEPGASDAQQRKGLARLRTTWRNVNSSLENIERRHFDGNFLQAVSQAPRKVGERASRIGEELGTAAVKLVEEAQRKEGQAGGIGLGPDPLQPGEATAAAAVGRAPEAFAAPSLSLEQFLDPGHSLPRESSTDLWEEREQLQTLLAEEREMRRGRALALNSLDEAIRTTAAELAEERRQLAVDEELRTVCCSRLDSAECALEELQEEHERVQSHQASLEPELRRFADAAAARARAERQASREGAWAREGPEMEALKLAKMELAELLSARDEVKLRSRREQAQLEREIEAAQGEHIRLRLRQAEQAKPKTLRASVQRLFGGARGGEAQASRKMDAGDLRAAAQALAGSEQQQHGSAAARQHRLGISIAVNSLGSAEHTFGEALR